MTDQQSSLIETGPPAGELAMPGTAIGRFLVLETLGVGGMGVVLSAYDPALDRKVAIKLLRGDRVLGAATRGRSQLVAEAQAMARLSHPNVVGVHEVAFADGAAYLVMDHIAGPTLRVWLAEQPRAWREVLAMFRGAGEGLAAAHREGIAHRDFKPENVLVDRDGRARVVDFGIAASVHGSAVASGSGPLAGTLAYMAPEQLRGEPCDVRADQFAFCVALWEALHGSRPFAGTTAAELEAAIAGAQITEPTGKSPEWLRGALRRGLAAAPAARWPSLDALLHALRRDRRTTQWWIGGTTAVVALGAAALWLIWPSSPHQLCPSAAPRLAGVWDAPRKAAVQSAFAATQLAYADTTWQEVSRRLDSYAAGWVDMAGQACRATRVDGLQSDSMLDLRMQCLDQRRSLVASLTGLWARGADAATLEHAIEAAGGLPPLTECADVRALSDRAQQPIDPAQAAKVAAIRPRLDEVLALSLADRWLAAKQAVASVRVDADATGWPALRAEAAFAQGRALTYLTDPAAEPVLLDAVRLAGAAHDDRLAARALTALAEFVAQTKQSGAGALVLIEIADGAVARAGDDDELRGRLLSARGHALLTSGNYAEARAAFNEARARLGQRFGADSVETLRVASDLASVAFAEGDFAIATKLYRDLLPKLTAATGEGHPRLATTVTNLAGASARAGEYDAAAGYYRQSLDIKLKALGPNNAGVALTMNNLGSFELDRGHLDAAQKLLERALEIRERVLGPEHGHVATTLGNLANLRRMQGAFAEAAQLLQRALAIKTKVYGSAHPSFAASLWAVAELARTQGNVRQALELQQRALTIQRTANGPDSPLTLVAMIHTARSLAALHRCGEARPLLAVAMPGLAKGNGHDPSDYAAGLAATAECDLASGAATPAVDGSGHALAISEKVQEPLANRGSYRWLLARALWAAGQHDEAIATARRAEQELGDNADGAIERAAAHSWLTARHQ